MDDPNQLVILVILSAVTTFFGVAETLISRLRKDDILKIADRGGKPYETLRSLLENPRRYTITIAISRTLLTTLIFLTLVAIIVPSVSNSLQTGLSSWLISIGVGVLIAVFFGDVLPKNYVRTENERRTITILSIIRAIHWLIFPITKILTFIGDQIFRLFGAKIDEHENSDWAISPETLQAISDVSDSSEILEENEREMVSRILDLHDKVAREVMIARTDMICLEVSAPQEEIIRTTIESRHSRIPIYEGRVDHMIGILRAKELLDHLAIGEPFELRSLIANRPPMFTPESKKVWELFQELQANKQHLAIVVDEYGGTAGMITIEDILEEIVGEIQDEYDLDEPPECVQLSETSYSIDARMLIGELNDLFGTQIEVEDIDTVGGLIVNHLGKVPEVGEMVFAYGLKFKILEAADRRIHRIEVER